MTSRRSVRPFVTRQRPISRAAYDRICVAMHRERIPLADVHALLGEFERAASPETKARLGIGQRLSRRRVTAARKAFQ